MSGEELFLEEKPPVLNTLFKTINNLIKIMSTLFLGYEIIVSSYIVQISIYCLALATKVVIYKLVCSDSSNFNNAIMS